MNVGRVRALGLGLSVLATLAGVTAATAEGVSLICAFSSGNNLLASYDYVEIDPDIDTLVLVATQDAAAAPIEYGSKESPPSRLSISQGVDQFVGGGFGEGYAISFEYREGIFTLASIWTDEISVAKWNCRPPL